MLSILRWRFLPMMVLAGYLALLGAIGYATHRLLDLYAEQSDNRIFASWNFNKLLGEHRRFQDRLQLFQANQLTAEQLRIQYEIYMGRFPIALTERHGQLLGALEGALPTLYTLRDEVLVWDDAVVSGVGLAQAALAIEQVLDRYLDKLIELNMRLMGEQGAYSVVSDHRVLRQLIYLLGGLLAIVLIGGGLFILLLHRQGTRMLIQAGQDPLTGLLNRSAFLQAVEAQVKGAKGRNVYLLLSNLVGFKQINSSMGHEAGDLLLKQLAHRLQRKLGEQSQLARIGGDHFAVVLSRDKTPASELAEQVLSCLNNPFYINQEEVKLQGHIGMACYPFQARNGSDLLKFANVALAQSQQVQRPWCLFEKELFKQVVRHKRLVESLRRALVRDELYLLYQPVVCLDSGRIEAVECLLRWQHPEYGNIEPGEIIELAEYGGLSQSLDRWILLRSCKQLALWHSFGYQDLKLSVNLSPQMYHAYLVNLLRQVLDETSIPPASLIIEITETTTMQELRAVPGLLQALTDTGVALALDDFGTGLSSLSYLQQLPVARVKVDRSFVRGIAADPQKCAMLDYIIQLRQVMDVQIVCEGIEVQDELAWLRRHRRLLGQGHFLSRPQPAEMIPLLLDHDLLPGEKEILAAAPVKSY